MRSILLVILILFSSSVFAVEPIPDLYFETECGIQITEPRETTKGQMEFVLRQTCPRAHTIWIEYPASTMTGSVIRGKDKLLVLNGTGRQQWNTRTRAFIDTYVVILVLSKDNQPRGPVTFVMDAPLTNSP